MRKYLYYIIPVVVCLVIAVCAFFCCNTFEPVWKDELPAECNMCLNTYKMYYSAKEKSGAVPAYDYCIKKLHRINCQAEVFGYNENGKPNPVNYDDLKAYNNFMKCLLELK